MSTNEPNYPGVNPYMGQYRAYPQNPYSGGGGAQYPSYEIPVQQPGYSQFGGGPPMTGAFPQGQGQMVPAGMNPVSQPPTEQSYIENILRLNLEKVATVYMTFENNSEWNAKVFRGEVEAAGRDHLIINDSDTGTRYLLPMIYLDYITFQGPINYAYPWE